ncbi:MAG: glycosyltransferase family 1 protein [Bacteroidia bacterium]
MAFDIPYPASYGGVIDIYYRIKALASLGVKVKLHCYQYGRKKSRKLHSLCDSVNYYSRKTFKNPFYGKLPYIVNSRNSSELLENLTKDDHPILFEGLHCTFYLNHPTLSHRYKIVRTHNIEHHYYRQLELVESRYFKKYFFRLEADKLKKYQNVLKHAQLIAAISLNDEQYLKKKFDNVMYLPAFHSNQVHKYPGQKGDFLLYHGNLGVAENYEAAIQLVNHLFSQIEVPCVIAGNNPPKDLVKLVDRYEHIELRSNISTEQIHKLIQKAHINVLHTNQATGIKLKLLNALYQGKFALVNPLMVQGTGIEDECVISSSWEEMQKSAMQLMEQDYSYSNFEERMNHLDSDFGNMSSANLLIDQIWSSVKRTNPKKVKTMGQTKNLTLISLLLSYFFS